MQPAGDQTTLQPLTVAVIDTDSGFVQVLAKRMNDLHWRHRVFAGAIPPDALAAMRLDALIVDLAVLGPSAWSYLDEVSADSSGLGVVVCTGPASVAQRVRGLRIGADDWMAKPCHPEELIARVQAVVRRRTLATTQAPAVTIEAGELQIRKDQFQVFAGGRSVELTRREFELLYVLATASDQVLEREDIYQRVWRYAMAHGDRSVDVFVRKLRQKLERASPTWRYIHTHFGVGYRFDAQPAEPSGGLQSPPEPPAEPVDEAAPLVSLPA